MTLEEQPSFPPLLKGEETLPSIDPFAKAVTSAALGADPGLICWARDETALRAALVLAPEAPLERAIGITFAVALGLGNALGALAPPEVAVHYVWPGAFKINGADCGAMRAAAATTDPATVPDWLVIGVEMRYRRPSEAEPGYRPGQTSLIEEGCIEVTPLKLLDSWSRHTLVWINRWLDDGFQPLHAAWRERAWGMGEDLADGGTFIGLESFGRATFIATAKIEEAEYAALIDRLAAHFVDAHGAPDLDSARPVAEDELRFMREMCEDQDPNTILFVTREMVEDGVSESFQAIKPKEATLDMVAIHGELDDI